MANIHVESDWLFRVPTAIILAIAKNPTPTQSIFLERQVSRCYRLQKFKLLREKGFIDYKKYGREVNLTPKGSLLREKLLAVSNLRYEKRD